MTLDQLIDSLPQWAKDLRLNFSSLVRNNTEMTPQQLWGTVATCAIVTRSAPLTRAVLEAAAAQLSPQALEATKVAAAIMSMNNIFYRFHHLSSNERYSAMPARLRMSALRGHGVEEVDFELWCLAASAVKGCGKCVDSHEHVVREKGASEELIMASIRVASVIHGLGVAVDTMQALGEGAVELPTVQA